MSKILEYTQKANKLADYHPKSWNKNMELDDTCIMEFRNKYHFISAMELIKAKDDSRCEISYEDALKELKQGKGTIPQAKYETIKHKIKESLLKRNLISENIYEGFEYSVEGDIIDIAKYVEGNPECMIVPKSVGKNYFYELYINVSVNWAMSNKEMQHRIAQVLATIELLEQEHIYIKLNVVDTSVNVNCNEEFSHILAIIPIFSHREPKDIHILSAIVNDRFLRKFMFTLSEDLCGDGLNSGYGRARPLDNVINISDDFNAVQTVEKILDELVIKCPSR